MGFCGVCDKTIDASSYISILSIEDKKKSALSPHICIRVGLEWQYRQKKSNDNQEISSAQKSEIYSGIEKGYKDLIGKKILDHMPLKFLQLERL